MVSADPGHLELFPCKLRFSDIKLCMKKVSSRALVNSHLRNHLVLTFRANFSVSCIKSLVSS